MLYRVFSILESQWLINQESVISYLPVLVAFMKGQEIVLKPMEDRSPKVLAFSDPGAPVGIVGKWNLHDNSIPENSVAIIPIQGPICSWDTMDLINYLLQAKYNDKINAVLMPVNSPGGMASQIDILEQTIKDLGKPVVGVVQGLTASAAMWVFSAMTERYATSKMDQIGSIGTMVSYRDFTGLLEKIGIKTTDFYATKSTLKNSITRELKDGNVQPLVQYMDFFNEVFHQAIMDNLGIPADSEVFTGDIYFAEKAQSLGLIDGITTMDGAIQSAYSLGLKNKIISQSKFLIH